MFDRSPSFFLFIIAVCALFIIGERFLSPTFQTCLQQYEQADQKGPAEKNPATFGELFISSGEQYISCSGEFIEAHNGAITALATLIIAAFTWTLSLSTRSQVQLTRDALIADKRAFIVANGVQFFWEIDNQTGQYVFRFRPNWTNTGDTPTKHFVGHVRCELRNSPLPVDFNFDYNTTETGGGIIGPKITLMGGLAPQAPSAGIYVQDILDVIAGRKFLYLFSWTRYYDIFPSTSQHITRFCWSLLPIGDPTTFYPGQQATEPGALQFQFVHYFSGNCADEECGDRK